MVCQAAQRIVVHYHICGMEKPLVASPCPFCDGKKVTAYKRQQHTRMFIHKSRRVEIPETSLEGVTVMSEGVTLFTGVDPIVHTEEDETKSWYSESDSDNNNSEVSQDGSSILENTDSDTSQGCTCKGDGGDFENTNSETF